MSNLMTRDAGAALQRCWQSQVPLLARRISRIAGELPVPMDDSACDHLFVCGCLGYD